MSDKQKVVQETNGALIKEPQQNRQRQHDQGAKSDSEPNNHRRHSLFVSSDCNGSHMAYTEELTNARPHHNQTQGAQQQQQQQLLPQVVGNDLKNLNDSRTNVCEQQHEQQQQHQVQQQQQRCASSSTINDNARDQLMDQSSCSPVTQIYNKIVDDIETYALPIEPDQFDRHHLHHHQHALHVHNAHLTDRGVQSMDLVESPNEDEEEATLNGHLRGNHLGDAIKVEQDREMDLGRSNQADHSTVDLVSCDLFSEMDHDNGGEVGASSDGHLHEHVVDESTQSHNDILLTDFNASSSNQSNEITQSSIGHNHHHHHHHHHHHQMNNDDDDLRNLMMDDLGNSNEEDCVAATTTATSSLFVDTNPMELFSFKQYSFESRHLGSSSNGNHHNQLDVKSTTSETDALNRLSPMAPMVPRCNSTDNALQRMDQQHHHHQYDYHQYHHLSNTYLNSSGCDTGGRVQVGGVSSVGDSLLPMFSEFSHNHGLNQIHHNNLVSDHHHHQQQQQQQHHQQQQPHHHLGQMNPNSHALISGAVNQQLRGDSFDLHRSVTNSNSTSCSPSPSTSSLLTTSGLSCSGASADRCQQHPLATRSNELNRLSFHQCSTSNSSPKSTDSAMMKQPPLQQRQHSEQRETNNCALNSLLPKALSLDGSDLSASHASSGQLIARHHLHHSHHHHHHNLNHSNQYYSGRNHAIHPHQSQDQRGLGSPLVGAPAIYCERQQTSASSVASPQQANQNLLVANASSQSASDGGDQANGYHQQFTSAINQFQMASSITPQHMCTTSNASATTAAAAATATTSSSRSQFSSQRPSVPSLSACSPVTSLLGAYPSDTTNRVFVPGSSGLSLQHRSGSVSAAPEQSAGASKGACGAFPQRHSYQAIGSIDDATICVKDRPSGGTMTRLVPILDYVPNWSNCSGGTKVLLIGNWTIVESMLANDSGASSTGPTSKGLLFTDDMRQVQICEEKFYAMFGETLVPALKIQDNVLRCYAPQSEPGFVALRVIYRNATVSEQVLFEMRATSVSPSLTSSTSASATDCQASEKQLLSAAVVTAATDTSAAAVVSSQADSLGDGGSSSSSCSNSSKTLVTSADSANKRPQLQACGNSNEIGN